MRVSTIEVLGVYTILMKIGVINEKGWIQNPYLGQFLFDASQAREPREIVQIQPQDLLLKTINPSQKAAVESVLSAK